MNDAVDTVSDQEIVELVLQGNKDEFRHIIERYRRRINAYLAKFLGYHQQDIEDVSSNTFIKVYVHLATYNPKLQFSSWLYRIAHNEAVNYLRNNAKHRSVAIDENHRQYSYTTDENTFGKQDLEIVLRQLNPSDRNILLLFYSEELSIRQIAEVLKTSENSVKSRLSQARNKARKLIQTPH